MTTISLSTRPSQADFTQRLVGPGGGAAALDGLRTLTGATLACVYGAACALRPGDPVSFSRAFDLALPVLGFAAAFAPSYFVLLTVTGHSPALGAFRAAVARGAASTGLVLAGFAPAVGLFELAATDGSSRALAFVLELAACAVAGCVGYRAFHGGVRDSLPSEERGLTAAVLALAFFVCATALAAKVWGGALADLSFAARSDANAAVAS